MNRRDWRSFDAYLFDIDGTLLHCADAVHYFAFCHVLSATAGRPVDLTGVTAHGNVDAGIVRDAMAFAGVAETVWRPRLPAMLAEMGVFCTERAGEMQVEPMAGAAPVLRMLRERGAKLGVATGNLRVIGELKLRCAALWPWFDFAAWSDGYEDRAAVFAQGVGLARSSAGGDAAILVVGDTPADIQAARANGLPVLAVASGVYTRDMLAAEGPDWCFASLADALQQTG